MTEAEPLNLRDYQVECLTTILARYKAGVRRQLVCLPTGTGKTVIFASFPSFFSMKKRMLVLAHREELLDQARDKILTANPHLKVEVEQAARSAGPSSDVVVASIPTLGRAGSKRLASFDPEQFYLVVVDEAHHAIAATYRRVLNHFSLFDPDTPRLLVGFTATPKRGDRQGLQSVFQEISFSRGLPEMIGAGYLAPVSGYRVETDVDLSRVRTRMGDFIASQLSKVVNVSARNQLVVKVFQDYLAERQTLCFCVDVAHSKSLAEAFIDAKIPAASVTGEMQTTERHKALDDFSRGRVRVLTNCMVLTEGYDESKVAGIILARPTKSSLLYTQMIGRGTRLHPGKEDVSVIDIVDVTREHGLVTLPSLFGLSSVFDLEGHTTTRVQQALGWVRQNRPWVRADQALSLSDLRYRCRRIDLLELQLPNELCALAEFAWTGTGPDTYRLSLAKGERLDIAPTILGDFEIALCVRSDETIVDRASTIGEAIKKAERWVEKHRSESRRLVVLGTRWRNAPASEKQLKALRSKGIAVPKGITKGQASHLFAMLYERRGQAVRDSSWSVDLKRS
ncbi:MAG: DEAD/DEAH box helicase [Deltaproteobacteria bacterium]|nr:DEAD/DEAH box helicase [Deltaproteobacteria bacterium]